MTFRLDPPRRCGDLVFAVLSEVSVSAHNLAGAVVGHGRKTPAAFVFHDGSGVFALDLRGRPLKPGRLEKRCPGMIAAIEAAAADIR